MKPGVRTSEFWSSLLAPLIGSYGVLAAQFGWGVTSDTLTNALPVVAALAAAVASHGYSKSRGAVKQAALDNAVTVPVVHTESGVDAAIAVMES
jgi:hypothetical protein